MNVLWKFVPRRPLGAEVSERGRVVIEKDFRQDLGPEEDLTFALSLDGGVFRIHAAATLSSNVSKCRGENTKVGLFAIEFGSLESIPPPGGYLLHREGGGVWRMEPDGEFDELLQWRKEADMPDGEAVP